MPYQLLGERCLTVDKTEITDVGSIKAKFSFCFPFKKNIIIIRDNEQLKRNSVFDPRGLTLSLSFSQCVLCNTLSLSLSLFPPPPPTDARRSEATRVWLPVLFQAKLPGGGEGVRDSLYPPVSCCIKRAARRREASGFFYFCLPVGAALICSPFTFSLTAQRPRGKGGGADSALRPGSPSFGGEAGSSTGASDPGKGARLLPGIPSRRPVCAPQVAVLQKRPPLQLPHEVRWASGTSPGKLRRSLAPSPVLAAAPSPCRRGHELHAGEPDGAAGAVAGQRH